jgi:hypothetical protein
MAIGCVNCRQEHCNNVAEDEKEHQDGDEPYQSRCLLSLMPRILSAAMGSVATIFVVDAVPKRNPDEERISHPGP